MPSKADLINDLDWITNRISDRVWVTSVGVLSFCLAFIVESIGAEKEGFLLPVQVIAPIVLALAALVFDLLQYLAGYKVSRDLLTKMEAQELSSMQFDRGHWASKSRKFFYGAKITLCIVSACWLMAVAVGRIFSLIQTGE